MPETYVRGMHAYAVHAYEMHAREMYANEMYASQMHAHEIHVRKIHACGWGFLNLIFSFVPKLPYVSPLLAPPREAQIPSPTKYRFCIFKEH